MPAMIMFDPTLRQAPVHEEKFDEKLVLQKARQDVDGLVQKCRDSLGHPYQPNQIISLVRIPQDKYFEETVKAYKKVCREKNKELRAAGESIHVDVQESHGNFYFVAGLYGKPEAENQLKGSFVLDLHLVSEEDYLKLAKGMDIEDKEHFLAVVKDAYHLARQGQIDLSHVVIDRTEHGYQVEQPENVRIMANAASINIGQDQLTDKEMRALENVKLTEEERTKLKLTDKEISQLAPSQIHDRQWKVLSRLFQDLSQKLHQKPFAMIGQDEQIRLLWLCFRLTKTDKYQPIGFVERSGSSEELYKAGEAISKLAGDCDDMSMAFAASALRLKQEGKMNFEEISIVWAVYRKSDEKKEVGHANTYVRIGEKSNHFVELTNEPKIVKFRDAESFDEKWTKAASVAENDRSSVDKLLFDGQAGINGYYWFANGRNYLNLALKAKGQSAQIGQYENAAKFFAESIASGQASMKKDVLPYLSFSLVKEIELLPAEEKTSRLELLEPMREQLRGNPSSCFESELHRGLSLVDTKEPEALEILIEVYTKEPWSYRAAWGIGRFYALQGNLEFAKKYLDESDRLKSK